MDFQAYRLKFEAYRTFSWEPRVYLLKQWRLVHMGTGARAPPSLFTITHFLFIYYYFYRNSIIIVIMQKIIHHFCLQSFPKHVKLRE